MDWKQARKALFQAVPGSFGMMGGYYKGQIPEEDVPVGENGYDAPSNVGIIIIGLLYGEGDSGRSICLATNAEKILTVRQVRSAPFSELFRARAIFPKSG